MLDKYILQFAQNINGLREFIELIGPIVNSQHEIAELERKKVTDSFDLAAELLDIDDAQLKEEKEDAIRKLLNGNLIKAEKVTSTEENFEKGIIIMMPQELKGKVKDALSNHDKTTNQKHLLYTNSLIGLLSSVEWFYSQVLHHFYDKFPSAAGIRKETMTLEDLKEFASIEDAEKFLIDSKIEEIFRGGFEHWIAVLTDELKLKVNFIKPFEDELIEVYQRRNLLVHNGGIVNSIYVTKVPNSVKNKKAIGERIIVTEKYLENAICKLHLVFTLIASELWKKLEPKEQRRSEILNDLAYKNMIAKRWIIAEGLSYFIKNDQELPSLIKTVGHLNYWLCKKRSGNFANVHEEIKNADFSDKSLRYQLALAALNDDVDQFMLILPDCLKTKSLLVQELIDYPIFEDMRATEQFDKFRETCEEFKGLVDFEQEESKS